MVMRMLLVVMVLFGGACAADDEDSLGATVPSAVDTGTVSAVATVFDARPEHPGVQWAKDGEAVDVRVLAAFAGPEHCEWETATFLAMGWPLGTPATPTNGRQFIRDPEGVLRAAGVTSPLLDAELPPSARSTGFVAGDIELWLGDDADDVVYLVNGQNHEDVEAWPRNDPMTGCA